MMDPAELCSKSWVNLDLRKSLTTKLLERWKTQSWVLLILLSIYSLLNIGQISDQIYQTHGTEISVNISVKSVPLSTTAMAALFVLLFLLLLLLSLLSNIIVPVYSIFYCHGCPVCVVPQILFFKCSSVCSSSVPAIFKSSYTNSNTLCWCF